MRRPQQPRRLACRRRSPASATSRIRQLRRSRRHLLPFGDPPFRTSTGRPRYVQAGTNRPLTGDPDDRVISGRAKRSRLAGVPCYLLAIAVAALSFVTTEPALAASGSAPF